MKLSPRVFTSLAPAPRSASVMRWRGAPGTYRQVGWNWMNSRLSSRAPARDAIATPDPMQLGWLEV